MGNYFGTDGIRGVANRELTPELAYRLGRAGAYVLTQQNRNEQEGKPLVVVGRDTRLSGEMLESALVAGMLSIGVDVARLGVVTTPGVAWLTKEMKASAGVMISASHNPFEDNGIKFFGHDGFKLFDSLEEEIEALLDTDEDRLPRPVGEQIGRVEDRGDAYQLYLQHLRSTIQTDLCGMDIVVDCANGAASRLAPMLLRDLGADVTAMCADPDGVNINVDCGSTHPERLRQEVLHRNAHLGLAFDGDADRLIAVDEQGKLVDGDQILCICADFMKEQGELKEDTLVTTVMSNIGLYKAMDSMGIRTEQTKVGDRYVMEKMRQGGFNLGGEQSGHIIFLDHNTTGDGMLTALQLLRVVKEKATTLNQLAQTMTRYPQILVNVPVREKEHWDQNQEIMGKIREVEQALGKDGRVLVRPSGTEPLIRVMAEGPDKQQLEYYVNKIADVIRTQLT
ncbi:phosphoglucosamine mutase [Kroppenstedtia eburnea]|uniref:Phosphoglucosamine mutase n=1 Tax=Kroppenstedtia eburnea TaxID=714067 RepID=A0A1N7P7M2_9BACL|nr:phosphoglucosamine mutase [Kroppenstedtia eburnea]QKI80808.1 phosphoglucosamine mutase [Kroppenstedtia eburnea]SIT06537.1 phosphoglucosamine mutase [Kroppenstedtia eburnea]